MAVLSAGLPVLQPLSPPAGLYLCLTMFIGYHKSGRLLSKKCEEFPFFCPCDAAHLIVCPILSAKAQFPRGMGRPRMPLAGSLRDMGGSYRADASANRVAGRMPFRVHHF